MGLDFVSARMRKTLLAITVVILVLILLAVVFIQDRKLSLAEDRVRKLETHLAAKEHKISELKQERDNSSQRLDEFRKKLQSSRASSDNKTTTPRNDVHSRVEALKEALARLPEQSIPELRLASDSDWYAAVDGELDTTDDYRRALGKLRSLTELKFAKVFQPMLREYTDANGGKFPSDISQLQPLIRGDIDVAMLQRYKVVPAKEVDSVSVGGDWAITQVSVIDSDYDSHSVFGPNGFGTFSKRTTID